MPRTVFIWGKVEIADYLSSASGADIAVTVPIDKALRPISQRCPVVTAWPSGSIDYGRAIGTLGNLIRSITCLGQSARKTWG